MAPKKSKPEHGSYTRWRPQKEKLLLELFVDAKFKPVGGRSNGRMDSQTRILWGPLKVAFDKLHPAVKAKIRENGYSSPIREEILVHKGGNGHRRKFSDLAAMYKTCTTSPLTMAVTHSVALQYTRARFHVQ